MADLLGGYFVYVPITFVIKGLVSLCSALLYRKVGKNSKSRYTAVILGGVADIILVAGGYISASTLSTEPVHSQAFRRTWSRESVD